ncbi:ADP-ribosylglycohydrolase family protein [Nonomuraea sp. NPDC048882]|uniref:ADP-ribosylglycohydrolase family protein n=1 Tax=Nonomuraea sp. NPDC048882 TaxID=3154347 RepID=UPI0033BFC5B8
MPISHEDTPPSAVALDRFVNRFKLTRHVVTLINDDPPPDRILYLHGPDGTGKSLLLRHLEHRACLRTDHWPNISDTPDTEFLDRLAEHGRPVPVARIDFGAPPAGDNRPLEVYSALFMLKHQLAPHRIATPRFDFAAITYLHKLGFDLAHRIRELFPSSEVDTALDIADALLTLPILRGGRHMLTSRMDETFTRRRTQRRLSHEDADHILALVPEPDLLYELPQLFAKDLNDAAAEHDRIVLLFDTHEAFFGDTDDLFHADKPMRDEWLRCLLGQLDLGAGIVAVVAGRTRPPWPSAPLFPIPEQYVDHRLVGPLTTADATRYLTLAGITDPAVRTALVTHASTAPGEVHPYSLGLCTDVALAAEGPLIDREHDLARRLPAEAERGILAVSACRAFTADTFHHLGQALGFPADTTAFARLTAFSFISPLPGGTSAYAMHPILRRSLQHLRPDEVRKAHEALARHYGERQEFTADLEAAYHLSHLDPDQGATAWIALMDRSLATGRFDRCRTLTNLLTDLRIDGDQGPCLYRVARAHLALGNWPQAEALIDGLPFSSAYAVLVRAEIAFYRGDLDQAEHLAHAALALTDEDARESFLFRLAEIELHRGRFTAGREHATEGLNTTTDQAPWLKFLAEIEYFSGNVERADTLINQALQNVADQPLYAALLQTAALIAEATGAWQTALNNQTEALTIRKAAKDARGIAQSLHGLGRAQCGLGLEQEAAQTLAEAGHIARDLGDDLLAARVTHSEADVHRADGDHTKAQQLTVQALREFEHHGTPYDVASACLSLSRLTHGRERVRYADRGRRAIAWNGFGILTRLFPDQTVPPAHRILNGLTGFCCGDALGVPWEGKPPQDIHLTDTLTAQRGWPPGSTSDDTEQLILLAHNLLETGGSEVAFLQSLTAALPAMRGAGPTTRSAVQRFATTGSPVADGGSTNGAMMRVLPIGWALPAIEAERRRDLAVRLTKTTHADPRAIAAACAVAAMGSWALEGCTTEDLVTVAREELAHFGVSFPTTWQPAPTGVSLEVSDTLGAILHILPLHDEPIEAMRYAVSLGGDTDTVAAIIGGILTCHQDTADIPWAPQVAFPPGLDTLAEGLRAMRQAAYG